MTMTINESVGRSAESNRSSRRSERTYDVYYDTVQSPTEQQVREDVKDWLIANGLEFDAWGNPFESIRVQDDSGGAKWFFRATASWSNRAIENPDYVETFSASPGTAHMTQALIQGCYAAGGAVPDIYEGGIGINDDLAFDGVDLVDVSPVINVDVKIPFSSMSDAQVGALVDYCRTINNVVVFGYQPGEVMFHHFTHRVIYEMRPDANGDEINTKMRQFTLEFHISRNRANYQAAPNIIVPLKRGWDYQWHEYWPTLVLDAATGGYKVTKYVVRTYISQVYAYTNWPSILTGFNLLR